MDAESTVIATLYKLSQQKAVPAALVAKAIKELGVDPESKTSSNNHAARLLICSKSTAR
jgi:pyruvate dehydrogenase complex dehydrogenase (E1) component